MGGVGATGTKIVPTVIEKLLEIYILASDSLDFAQLRRIVQ
jgi:hypothetical protein